MDDSREIEVDKFPHIQDNPAQLKELHQSSPNISNNQKMAPFRRRFPGLAFRNVEDGNRYSYIGKFTEKNTPFLVSFDVKSTSIENNRRQIIESQMQRSINALVDTETLQQQKIFTQLKSKVQYSESNEDLIGQAYILTGMAKPSITINQIYDALFYQIQPTPTEFNKSEENSSQMSSIQLNEPTGRSQLIGYFKIRNSWEEKRKSYEFHKLMCRAYIHYQQHYRKFYESQSEEWKKISLLQQKQMISNKIFNQLFSKMRSRHVQLYNQSSRQELSISDHEYYNYFIALFKNHAKEILQKIETFQQKSENDSSLQISLEKSQIKPFRLERFNYRQFALNLCAGVKLSEESILNIIDYRRKSHEKVLNMIQFKTKDQKLQSLVNLSLNNNQSFAIKLVPIGEVKSNKIPEQIDNYLIVVQRHRRIRQTQLNLELSLSELLSDDKESNKASIMVRNEFTIIKQNLFQAILDIKNLSIVLLEKAHNKPKKIAHRSNLLQLMSFNPKNIIFDLRNKQVYPKFQYALQRYLEIDKLPLSYEQKMLAMTPKTDIDIYEVIQNLYEDFKIVTESTPTLSTSKQQKIKYLLSICQRLSSEHLVFTLNIAAANKNLDQLCNIQKSKGIDNDKLFNSYQQIENQVMDKKHEILQMSQMEKEKAKYFLFQDKYKELVQLCLDSISKSELFKLLMLSIFDYQFRNKVKHLFYKQVSQEEFYFDVSKEPYQVGSQQDQRIMYQFGMILLICSRVISCVDFSFPQEQKNESQKVGDTERPKDADLIIKAIIEEHFLQNLIEYFKSLFQIARREIEASRTVKSEKKPLTINAPMQLDQGPLQSLFVVYDQLMTGRQDFSNEAHKAIIKAGLINNLYKEGMQIIQKLVNIDQQLKYLQDFKVNSLSRNDRFENSRERDFQIIGFESIYNQVEQKYNKISQLYFKSKEKYSNVRIQNYLKSFQSNTSKFSKKVLQILKITENKRSYIESFYKKQITGHHVLQDIKKTIIKTRKLEKQMKQRQKGSNQYKQKELNYIRLLNQLADYAILSKKDDPTEKKEESIYKIMGIRQKKQLNQEIKKQCKYIEECQITLFNQIHFNCHAKKKLIKIKNSEKELQAEDIKSLRLLMFFLYSQSKFDKNYIERLNSPLVPQQVNYELVRMMGMLTVCNIQMWESQTRQKK